MGVFRGMLHRQAKLTHQISVGNKGASFQVSTTTWYTTAISCHSAGFHLHKFAFFGSIGDLPTDGLYRFIGGHEPNANNSVSSFFSQHNFRLGQTTPTAHSFFSPGVHRSITPTE